MRIKNFNRVKLSKNNFVYHAGTKFENNKLISTGGRVLNFTAKGKKFFEIRKKVISLIKKLNWKNGFYRKDIGWRIINKYENN